MAARTSTSVGVGVTVVLLSIATLALLVTTIIFLSQRNAAEKKLAEAQDNIQEIIRPEDRNNPIVQQRQQMATKERQSLVKHLVETQRTLMGRVTGTDRDSVADFERRLSGLTEQVGDTEGSNLLGVLTRSASRARELESQVADARAAADRARLDQEAEARRVGELRTAQEQTLAALNGQLDTYKNEVDALREEVNSYKGKVDESRASIVSDYEARIAQLGTEIDTLQRDRILKDSMITKLQNQLKGLRPEGVAEFALTDGQIIGLAPGENAVTINLGKNQRVPIGMTFEVYSEASAIRPDAATGEYPAGKASIEVIRVDATTATARVLREKRGNPVVRGDVIANAIYDPNKTYRFLLYGNFDANRDGTATALEREDYRAMIEQWGGKVTDDLTGDVDYLVLGSKPVLPPAPGVAAPQPVVEEYIRLQRASNKYDELYSQAQSTSIPILNENRLRTLIGQ